MYDKDLPAAAATTQCTKQVNDDDNGGRRDRALAYSGTALRDSMSIYENKMSSTLSYRMMESLSTSRCLFSLLRCLGDTRLFLAGDIRVHIYAPHMSVDLYRCSTLKLSANIACSCLPYRHDHDQFHVHYHWTIPESRPNYNILPKIWVKWFLIISII